MFEYVKGFLYFFIIKSYRYITGVITFGPKVGQLVIMGYYALGVVCGFGVKSGVLGWLVGDVTLRSGGIGGGLVSVFGWFGGDFGDMCGVMCIYWVFGGSDVIGGYYEW